MSRSAIIEEDSSWAQTFVTVTPQDDGYLREIEDTCVVSGKADVPLNLDTWNIVLRRSLNNTTTTRDFIDPRELDVMNERVTTECQTYLQGFPKVELPIVYRDEATQTLYIGDNDEPIATQTTKLFDDMIAVMNEKPLPKWRKTQTVQTVITFEYEPSLDYLVNVLERVIIIDERTESSITKSPESKIKATTEAQDLLNFVLERTLWMTEPIDSTKKEKKDANIETMIKYNEGLKKLMIDHEIQTSLTCKPKESNSMLLADYQATKKFCRKNIEDCLENGVDRRIIVDNVIDDIVDKSKRQLDFPNIREVEFPQRKIADEPPWRDLRSRGRDTRSPNSSRLAKPKSQKTRDILLAEKSARYGKKSHNEIKVNKETNWRVKSQSSSSESEHTNLTQRDEEALGILKNTFCTCPVKIESFNYDNDSEYDERKEYSIDELYGLPT